ncbi:hypothetical protein X777_14043 [Ooceraea biroi]|uniref:Uncharacterized protein n=1 Tax=Ooceraea biroi TaxID=2015173 RepID=A0A026VWK1_OOCBI|nr:hypothetical protein X777_14043 [Ooceraea biroi]
MKTSQPRKFFGRVNTEATRAYGAESRAFLKRAFATKRDGKPDEKRNETERKRVGFRCGTVGVRSFGALVLGAQRAYRRRLVDRFSRSSRVETTLRSPAFCSVASPRVYAHANLHICLHTYTRTHSFPEHTCAGTPSRTDHRLARVREEIERGNGDANRKENERVGNFYTLDGVEFHQHRFRFSWRDFGLNIAVRVRIPR